jgi:hypothetical protein
VEVDEKEVSISEKQKSDKDLTLIRKWVEKGETRIEGNYRRVNNSCVLSPSNRLTSTSSMMISWSN